MRESDLTRNIVKALNQRPGCWAVKIHGGPHQRVGLPDIMGCYDGRFFGLEVKLPGKEKNLTAIQARTLDLIRKAGGIAEMVTTVKGAIRALEEAD